MDTDRCVKCGGARNWQRDGVLQEVCYECAYPSSGTAAEVKQRPFPPPLPEITREMINDALEYQRKFTPTVEGLRMLMQLQERRNELRMLSALEDGRLLQETLVEDIGTVLASADASIDPYRGWREMVHRRMDTDPRFRATVTALLHLMTEWIDAERDACAKIATTPAEEPCPICKSARGISYLGIAHLIRRRRRR